LTPILKYDKSYAVLFKREICNESTGAGCGGVAGDYNADPLKNGETVTNPGDFN